MKKPQYRKFDYIPRFYKPENDEEERRKRKLGFRYARSTYRRKAINPIIWIILIVLILLILLKLGKF